MLDRRILLFGAGAVLAGSIAAQAADWKSQYSDLTFAVVPAENASGVSDRYAPFMAYLTKELGVPVKLRIANDYAAVIEGQRASNIQIAYYGPASYSTAYLTGVKTEPFVTTRNNDGAIGYYSVIYVKADSPYKDIRDLKGKTIGFVDPNSTSGYNAPRFYLMPKASLANRSSPAATKTGLSRWRKAPSIARRIGGTPMTTRT
jgi:phosphonate transport system substrate-binding protein